ncbi:hypothetical protein KAI87_17965, partial [Myxococcota bacterium]|nr:hypothetical protein [Myxococcota bacterium]
EFSIISGDRRMRNAEFFSKVIINSAFNAASESLSGGYYMVYMNADRFLKRVFGTTFQHLLPYCGLRKL